MAVVTCLEAISTARPGYGTDRAFTGFIIGGAYAAAGLSMVILAVLAVQGAPILWQGETGLWGTVWAPSKGVFGIVPMLFGSIIVMLIAMAMALPLGVLSAIYISETRSAPLRRGLKAALEILAGIPSIVYGLIGVSFLSVFIGDIFDLQSGRVILTAGLLLAVMILPTILTLTEDALAGVPRSVRENAAALGLYRYEVTLQAMLPAAAPQICAAGLLALGRALGETMAVMLVIGSLDRLPSPLLNVLSSGQTITSKLGREVGESAFGSMHFSALIFTALILVSLTFILTASAQILLRRGGHV